MRKLLQRNHIFTDIFRNDLMVLNASYQNYSTISYGLGDLFFVGAPEYEIGFFIVNRVLIQEQFSLSYSV
ncbi:MAG: hypothetical protein C4518_08160 [Desulfobacteraceae bacterium]|nr:MAG: hypothetical protein C4518_08160 [Desulfobacteraceae bacterium]